LYFAYGSNLDERQMLRRCERVQIDSIGVLRNHRLVFAGWSSGWDSPVATVVPHKGTDVPGVLYQIDRRSLLALDRCEGHPYVYRRRDVLIHIDSLRACRAHVYFLNLSLPAASPRPRYFLTILRAYREWGFDETPLVRAALDG
jgi:gamma-glutamylcyclotransferase (GGCT)/AIG2-like uncharacterized protein YtfP